MFVHLYPTNVHLHNQVFEVILIWMKHQMRNQFLIESTSKCTVLEWILKTIQYIGFNNRTNTIILTHIAKTLGFGSVSTCPWNFDSIIVCFINFGAFGFVCIINSTFFAYILECLQDITADTFSIFNANVWFYARIIIIEIWIWLDRAMIIRCGYWIHQRMMRQYTFHTVWW